jgi:glutathione S-transferase
LSAITFYTNPMSRGRTVRWMLEEIAQPYDTEVLDYGTTMKADEYLAINPMGKVPTIVHEGTVVSEAAAICAYLADAFPEAALAPAPGSRERGPYYRWMFYAAGPVEAMFTNSSLGFEPPPERRSMVGYGCREDVLKAIEVAVSSGDYLAGTRFTAADLYFGAQIGFMMRFGMFKASERVQAYVARVQGRPAFQRAAAIDDALMPAKP